MKKENLGKKIICGIIVMIIILVAIIMIYINSKKTSNNIVMPKNETNVVTNEIDEDTPQEVPTTQNPDDAMHAGVGE